MYEKLCHREHSSSVVLHSPKNGCASTSFPVTIENMCNRYKNPTSKAFPLRYSQSNEKLKVVGSTSGWARPLVTPATPQAPPELLQQTGCATRRAPCRSCDRWYKLLVKKFQSAHRFTHSLLSNVEMYTGIGFFIACCFTLTEAGCIHSGAPLFIPFRV